MAILIMIAVLEKKKSKSAQYRFVQGHRAELRRWLNLKRFPSRTTYFDRYRRGHRIFEVAIRLQGEKAIAEGVADPTTVAVDKSLAKARGPVWHKKQRQAGILPKWLRGVDTDSTWGYSEHHGWVQGYSYEVAVTAGQGAVVFPLLASADTASVSEHVSFSDKIDHLPKQTKSVLGDRGYDNNQYAERIEWDARGRRTGRRFICPPQGRNTLSRDGTAQAGTRWARQTNQVRRQKRIAFYRSARGRKLYAQRSRMVEPFNEWFKALFELNEHVWHRGLGNNRTQLLAAIFGYQLLVRHNFRRGRPNGQIKWMLDQL